MRARKNSRFQPDLPEGWRLETIASTASTNADVMARAEAGEPEALALRADLQTAGRGRRGRAWDSPKGNLYLSILIDAPVAIAGQAGFAAALALIDGIEAETGQDLFGLRCKWPNDLLYRGAKVAGLLLEAVPGRDQVVIGMGVNLVPMEVTDAVYPVGSLADLGVTFDLDRLAGHVCVALADRLGTWRTAGFKPLRTAWLERAHGLQEPVTVRLPNENLEGQFLGLAEDGALRLGQESGERMIPAGDVFFAPARDAA